MCCSGHVGKTDAPPKWIEPQLTRVVDEAPAGNDWLHEIKYDGYRMHARVAGGCIQFAGAHRTRLVASISVPPLKSGVWLAVIAGSVLGLALFGKVNDLMFRRIVLAALLISGLAMPYPRRTSKVLTRR